MSVVDLSQWVVIGILVGIVTFLLLERDDLLDRVMQLERTAMAKLSMAKKTTLESKGAEDAAEL